MGQTINGNQRDWLDSKSENRPFRLLREADSNFNHRVKQTSDAVGDAAIISHSSSHMNRKASQILFDSSIGIDIDNLVHKCNTCMLNTQKLDHSRIQSQGRQIHHADKNDGDQISELSLDWATFGHHVCLRASKRPAVPNFLLGPLSVEKKHRRLTQREPHQTRNINSREVHPEVVLKNTLQSATLSELPALTIICTQIMNRFSQDIAEGARVLEQQFNKDDVDTASYKQACTDFPLTSNGGIRLLDWIINSHSLGQSVENLLYTTFLIKEGALGIYFDDDGHTPILLPSKLSTIPEQRRHRAEKYQAILALDYAVWRQLIELYDIQEPLIPHRSEPGEEFNNGG